MKKDKIKFKYKFFLAFVAAASTLVIGFAFFAYQLINTPNVLVTEDLPDDVSEDYVYTLLIKKGDTFDDVVTQLAKDSVLVNEMYFRSVAKFRKYPEHIKAGRYIIEQNMSNFDLVQMLRAGKQTPVKITFNNVRLKKDLGGKLCKNIAADSLKFSQLLNDPTVVAKYGFDTTTIACMFLPNTYEVYWTIDEHELLDKMHVEYKKVWTEERLQKADKQGLTPIQVSILASIVDSETIKKEEKKRIAGLYLNRLNKNWNLAADPTVVFAVGDFTIKRVLSKYLEIDSPYNTYKYSGLPPGPIRIPTISAIDAVLNPEQHKYMFMCAKEDFSGFHNFAITGAQHSRNANKYRLALSRAGIRK
jgi:UPF0755 protein